MKLEYPNDEFSFLFDFINEAREHLSGIEDNVLRLESEPSKALLESIYRPMHSIKGMAGFVNLNNIKHLTHETEDLVEGIKSEKVKISSDLIDLLIKIIDRINKMIRIVAAAAEPLHNEKRDLYIISFEEIEYLTLIDELTNIKNASKISASKPEKLKDIPIQKQMELLIPASLKKEFIEESEEHLSIIDEYLLKLEENDFVNNDIGTVMRELHTMKGGSQILLSSVEGDTDFQNPICYIQKITHSSETLLQQIHKGNKKIEPDMIEIFFSVVDILKSLVLNLKNNQIPSALPVDIIIRLSNYTGEKKDDEFFKLLKSTTNITADDFAFYNTAIQNLVALNNLCSEIISKPDDIKNIIKKILRSLKTCRKAGEYHNKKDFTDFCNCQINFFIFLKENENDLNQVFIQSSIDDFAKMHRELEKEYELKNVKKSELTDGKQKDDILSTPALTDKIQEQDTGLSVIKVPMEKVDKLMSIIGELIISKGSLQILSREITNKYNLTGLSRKVKEISDGFNRLSEELQLTIMNIRMLPVKTVFSRYPRMVRDIAKKSDKKVKLITKGEETELDKTIIEKIGDPLLHMIRNSVDHGIEPPEERKKCGKQEEGSLILSAWNQGNNVFIELQDDGKGIDEEAVKNKAIEKGLISKNEIEKFSKKEMLNFIFAPGFSTAKKVTEVSGRGVGMDVVRTNIISIGGFVEIDSEIGRGTKILLILPLTLAVSKGLEVKCGHSNFIIPLDCVIETVKIKNTDVRFYKTSGMFYYRNSILPIIDLCERFKIISQNSKESEISLVIIILNNLKIAVKVDMFLSERDIVVKPLPQTLENLSCVSGTTIMPDGHVELILNLKDLL